MLCFISQHLTIDSWQGVGREDVVMGGFLLSGISLDMRMESFSFFVGLWGFSSFLTSGTDFLNADLA